MDPSVDAYAVLKLYAVSDASGLQPQEDSKQAMNPTVDACFG
jgi:hypothetical protein